MNGRNTTLLLVSILVIALIATGTFLGFGPMKSWISQLNLGLDIEGGVAVVYEGENTTGASAEDFSKLMDDTLSVLSRRVNSFGLTEPNITKQGENRIRIELPGAKDINQAVEMIGKTAVLEFYQMDEKALTMEGQRSSDANFKGKLLFKGNSLTDAGAANYDGKNVVTFKLNDEASAIFSKSSDDIVNQYQSKRGQIAIVLDGEVISAPMVTKQLSGNDLMIEGSFTPNQAILLANLIKGGSLPMQLKEVQTQLINATLGRNALQKSVMAGLIGFALVAAFMLLRYRVAGIIAVVALVLYASLTFLALILFSATLTLPGIAGLILSVGMAVDANVIILERLREEMGLGKSLRASIRASYQGAMTTIIDSNVTTLVAGIILYYFGEGPIKGFAITLSLGILLSMFTAIIVTRFMMNRLAGIKSLQKRHFYGYKDPAKKPFQFDFVRTAKIWIALSLAVMLIGGFFFFSKGFNLGIDFTGGTLLNVNMGKVASISDVEKAISGRNLSPSIIHSGEGNKEILIKTKSSLNSAERKEVFQDLQKAFALPDEAFLGGEQFGPAIGQEISHRAMISVVLATLAILIYVWLRFKLNYGIAAIVALIHDTLVLLSIYAIMRITVSSSFIAAVLTIVGYSINDTIVVFDKLRENSKRMRGESPEALTNLSINQTLTRTIFTSLTTFLVVAVLYVLGVSSVREFAFPLLWGIIVGSYSTIFIAGPLWVWLRKKGM